MPAIPLNWKDEFTVKHNAANPQSVQGTTCPISLDWNKSDSTVTKAKLPSRVSTRNRTLPVTRSNDFLW